MRQFEIRPVDCGMEATIDAKIDNLNKPKHSLGLLEKLAKQILTSIIPAIFCWAATTV